MIYFYFGLAYFLAHILAHTGSHLLNRKIDNHLQERHHKRIWQQAQVPLQEKK